MSCRRLEKARPSPDRLRRPRRTAASRTSLGGSRPPVSDKCGKSPRCCSHFCRIVLRSLCDPLVLRGYVPVALGPEHDGRVRADRNCVLLRRELLDELDIGLFVTVEVERLLAFDVPESEDDPP